MLWSIIILLTKLKAGTLAAISGLQARGYYKAGWAQTDGERY
jgi:hypothetical protein